MKKSLIVLAAIALVGVPASAQIFTTADAAVPIPDNSAGTITACQTINVPASVVIASLEVEITSAHSWIGDVTFELTAPDGTSKLTVANRPGRTGTGAGESNNYLVGVPIRFSNIAPSGVSAEDIGALPCAGDPDGSADCPDNYLPAPDTADTPIAGLGTDLDDFNTTDAMGNWMLCAGDSAGGDTGTLTSWRLGVNQAVPVELMGFSID